MKRRTTITSKEVQTEVYQLLTSSPLGRLLSGGVYMDTARLKKPHEECFCVRYTSGQNGDVQAGVVTVLAYTEPIYTPDGHPIEDIQRTRALEEALTDWAETLPTGRYLWMVPDTVQTLWDVEAEQFFTSIRIEYNHF